MFSLMVLTGHHTSVPIVIRILLDIIPAGLIFWVGRVAKQQGAKTYGVGAVSIQVARVVSNVRVSLHSIREGVYQWVVYRTCCGNGYRMPGSVGIVRNAILNYYRKRGEREDLAAGSIWRKFPRWYMTDRVYHRLRDNDLLLDLLVDADYAAIDLSQWVRQTRPDLPSADTLVAEVVAQVEAWMEQRRQWLARAGWASV